MTLQELKKMIAEEYTAYKKSINEQPDMPEMPGVAVSDNDIDATGGGNAEATLKDIYEMLKDFFEGGDEAADDAADDAAAAAADDDADDVEEGHGGKMYDEDDKDVKKESAGKNVGYKTVNENKRSNARLIAENRLQSRFKKLANIK